jgi:UDP-N-acetyl-D-mannosaminuronic acid dehydrogenase
MESSKILMTTSFLRISDRPENHKPKINFDCSKSICVIGQGYIGLPTAAILANRGYKVLGVDVRKEAVDKINSGKAHIHEPNLDELIEKVVASGNLRASMTPERADIFILCVPTPFHGDHSPDLSFVQKAAESIRPLVQEGTMVILESTSPPGTTEDVVLKSAIPDHLTPGENVHVAYCPERVLPGRILIECIENDRIIGGVTKHCAATVANFYNTFVTGKIHTTTAKAAEMAKLTENAFRDVNIAFANELSILSDKLGVSAFEVIRLANCHPRVNILNPGPGVGGHCISVDPWFLVHADPSLTPLIRTAREVNDSKPKHVIAEVLSRAHQFSETFNHLPTIACLGLAYKADVDDFRESPSIDVVKGLKNQYSGSVLACDPYSSTDDIDGIELVDLQNAVTHADIVVLLTDHKQFLKLSHDLLAQKIIIDPRGLWQQIVPVIDQVAGQAA